MYKRQVADGDLAVALSVLGVTPADVVAAEWIDNGTGVENAGFHVMGVAQDEGTDGPAFVGDGRDQFVGSGRGGQITDVVHIVEVTGRNVPTVGDETRHDPRGDAVGSRGTGDESNWHVANGTRAATKAAVPTAGQLTRGHYAVGTAARGCSTVNMPVITVEDRDTSSHRWSATRVKTCLLYTSDAADE